MKQILSLFLALTLFISAGYTATEAEAATIKLNRTSLSLHVGKSATLKVKGTTAKAKWTSSKKSVATVSKKGKVKAKKAGTTTITAKIDANVSKYPGNPGCA